MPPPLQLVLGALLVALELLQLVLGLLLMASPLRPAALLLAAVWE